VTNYIFLDTWKEIYFWIGRNTSATSKTVAEKMVKEYTSQASQIRNLRLEMEEVMEIVDEPIEFTRFFHGWTPKRTFSDPRDQYFHIFLEKKKQEEKLEKEQQAKMPIVEEQEEY